MVWMVFGNNIFWIVVSSVIAAYAYAMYRRHNELQRLCYGLQLSNIRLTQHLDFLIRRFHLVTPPYVADTTKSTSGIGQPMTVRCWHCQRSQHEPHDASCPWHYVQNNIEYVDHRPTLRKSS